MYSDQYAAIERARNNGHLVCVTDFPEADMAIVELFEVHDYDTGIRKWGLSLVRVDYAKSGRDPMQWAYHAIKMSSFNRNRPIKHVVANVDVSEAFRDINMQERPRLIIDDMQWRRTNLGPMNYSSIPGFVRMYNNRKSIQQSLTESNDV